MLKCRTCLNVTMQIRNDSLASLIEPTGWEHSSSFIYIQPPDVISKKKKAQGCWLILVRQVVGNPIDKISNNPAPVSWRYDGRAMPLILSIVLEISYVRRTRIKLHFRIQYVLHKSKKQSSEMQRLCTSFFRGCCRFKFRQNKVPKQGIYGWKINFVSCKLG